MRLSVIIVNYNVKYFLEQCLCAVIKACDNLAVEILVVDNLSSDGSQAFFANRFPQVQFTWCAENLGFAKANNLALANARGEYILFLNPDTIVPEDCFRECLSFMDQHPDAGALGIRMVDGSGHFLKESKRAFPSPLTSFYKLSGLARMFPKSQRFARYYLGHLPEMENHQVDVLAGAFMLIPARVLEQTGSFDETFFMYGEDVDLSYRIQQTLNPAAGRPYANYYFAQSSIIHFKGESTKKGSLNYVRMFYKAMSQFVKKHYSGSRAAIFNFFVQAAIRGRALLAAGARFLQRLGLPLLDAALILISFWVIKLGWSYFIRHQVNYSPNMLVIAFPVFSLIFLAAAYYAGLYDKGYRQAQLNGSVFFASLLLLSGYALLPESLRFSRGILVFGILLAFVLMSLLRRVFVQNRLLYTNNEEEEHRQTVIVANPSDYQTVTTLMQQAGMQERVLGRISTAAENETGSLGSIEQLPGLLKTYPVKEVIFCEDGLSFKQIIATVQLLPGTVRNKFHASGSKSIVGSDSKDLSGGYVAKEKQYAVGLPINRRNKGLLDMLLAILLLVSFPLHLFFMKNQRNLFANITAVLLRRKTWVGYAAARPHLPALKPGILTSTALPARLNQLPSESLQVSDEWYAEGYSVYTDWEKIKRGYRYLGI